MTALAPRRSASYAGALARAYFAACAMAVIVATAFVLFFIGRTGIRGVLEVGLGQLLGGSSWRPEAEVYGGLPLIFGTLTSACGAVVLGAGPAVLAAIYTGELAPARVAPLFRRVMELAAAVPSVVYGWLALTWIVPAMHRVAAVFLGEDRAVGGEGLASSAVLLAIMLGPTVSLLALDALGRVPPAYRESSAALGATPIQTAFRISLPTAWRGLVIAVFFGFARAAGETMAVQMVIGGARQLPADPFSPTTTISAQIVMDMQNARPDTPASDVLYSMALVLLILSASMVLFTRALARGRS